MSKLERLDDKSEGLENVAGGEVGPIIEGNPRGYVCPNCKSTNVLYQKIDVYYAIRCQDCDYLWYK